MRHRIKLIASTLVAAGLVLTPLFHADAAPPHDTLPASVTVAAPDVPATLRALAVLHSYGYTINTPKRADRAIRHWQKINGLTVDGNVGPETLGSLGLGSAHADPPAAPASRPSTPAPADPRPGVDEVKQIIRDAWPDDVEDWAIRIASRETGRTFDPAARNSCCWGLFQIHFRAHRAWLATQGVTDPHQLLDAGTNARVAAALYAIAGEQPWEKK